MICDAISECASLLGEGDCSSIVGQNIAGLGFTALAASVHSAAERLKNDNMFKILFVGACTSGKSTTVNALLGEDLLPMSATAATAVISRVVYGENTNTVKVFHEDNHFPETLAMDKFMDDYCLSDDDLIMIENEGGTDRFKDIDYVLHESNSEFLKNGVQVIDTPSLFEAVARTKTTNKFMLQANAMVFLIDACKLFSDEEKKFIRKHFVNAEPKPRNVFFLVNRINCVHSDADREAVKRHVQMMLKLVFTEDFGYNQALYDERVFFGDSYGALQKRKAGEIPYGTGFPEFMGALERYLASDSHLISKYESVITHMRDIYMISENWIKDNTALLKQDVTVLEANRAKTESVLNELSKRIESMEKFIERAKKNITNKILNSLETFVEDDLVNDWVTYAADCDEHFGILDMFKLALPFVSEETKQNILNPMVEFVNKYVTNKLEDWGNGIPLLIDSDIAALQEDLEDQSMEFAQKLEQTEPVFKGSNNILKILAKIHSGRIIQEKIASDIHSIVIPSVIGVAAPVICNACECVVALGITPHSADDEILGKLGYVLFPYIGGRLIDSNKSAVINCVENIKVPMIDIANEIIADIEKNLEKLCCAKMDGGSYEKEMYRQEKILAAFQARVKYLNSLIYRS